jgi:hypothetical protein
MKKKRGFESVLEFLDENTKLWVGKNTNQIGRLLLKHGFKECDIQEAFAVQVFNSEQYGGQ